MDPYVVAGRELDGLDPYANWKGWKRRQSEGLDPDGLDGDRKGQIKTLLMEGTDQNVVDGRDGDRKGRRLEGLNTDAGLKGLKGR